MTVSAELELALAHLLRAKELAQFYTLPEDQQQKIDLLKRATAKVRKQVGRS